MLMVRLWPITSSGAADVGGGRPLRRIGHCSREVNLTFHVTSRVLIVLLASVKIGHMSVWVVTWAKKIQFSFFFFPPYIGVPVSGIFGVLHVTLRLLLLLIYSVLSPKPCVSIYSVLRTKFGVSCMGIYYCWITTVPPKSNTFLLGLCSIPLHPCRDTHELTL